MKTKEIYIFILHTDFVQYSTRRVDSGFIYPSLHVVHLLFVLPDLMIIMIFSEIGLLVLFCQTKSNLGKGRKTGLFGEGTYQCEMMFNDQGKV